MKQETYNQLMEVWDEYLDFIEDLKDDLVHMAYDIPFTEKSKEDILTGMSYTAGRISGLQHACEKIRAIMKHSDLED